MRLAEKGWPTFLSVQTMRYNFDKNQAQNGEQKTQMNSFELKFNKHLIYVIINDVCYESLS